MTTEEIHKEIVRRAANLFDEMERRQLYELYSKLDKPVLEKTREEMLGHIEIMGQLLRGK